MSAISPAVVLMFVTATCTGIAAMYDDTRDSRRESSTHVFASAIGASDDAATSRKCHHCHLGAATATTVASATSASPLP